MKIIPMANNHVYLVTGRNAVYDVYDTGDCLRVNEVTDKREAEKIICGYR